MRVFWVSRSQKLKKCWTDIKLDIIRGATPTTHPIHTPYLVKTFFIVAKNHDFIANF